MRHRFRVEHLFQHDAIGIWLIKDDTMAHETFIAEPVSLKYTKSPQGFMLPDPTMMIDRDDAEQLLPMMAQELVSKGYAVTTDAGELSATKKHLEDMQKLTFGLVDKV